MSKIHNVQFIQVDDTFLHLTVDGQSYHIRLEECSPRLARATPAQRQHVEVSPSGYGLHWPEVDEDLAITPLLQHAETLAMAAN
jgi:hypothetical protein